MRRAVAVAIALGLVGFGAPRAALARRGVRLFFEPTDLELEGAGVIELDAQLGLVKGQAPWRLVVPDFEVDIGVTRNFEIDIDGAYSVEESKPDTFHFDSPAPDNVWVCGKLGLVDWAADDDTPDAADAWVLGTQVGPKLPVIAGSHGVGVEGLMLLGHVIGRSHFALNLGAFVDPHPTPAGARPVGLEAGLDFSHDVDARGLFQLTIELAGVHFTSPDPDQLLATAGVGFSPTPDTQITLTALYGFLGGNDRYGTLMGVAHKLRYFEAL
jgi:hypothetical protein